MNILKPLIISAMAGLFSAAICSAETPQWLESDSVAAIEARLKTDFPYTVDQIKQQIDFLDSKTIDKYIKKGYIETLTIDGKRMVHRKAARNVKLLAPELAQWSGRGSTADENDIRPLEEILQKTTGDGVPVKWQRVTYRFTIDVPTVDALRGDTLKVWMPVPIASVRQRNVKILSATPEQYVLSTLDRSVHNTIFFKSPVADDVTHFEYVAQFEVGAQYFAPEYILAKLKPYDTKSDLYKKYTAFEAPHIVNLEQLAKTIVGDERNPFRQSELVYDYIESKYPWAGAREYSTIPCMPRYVIESGHGDCGQVSLLYISLMRSLGVPARWESGWVTQPGAENLHDWAEVYFEGVGWVPIDMSYGRFTPAENIAAVNFFSTGFDQWRMAANLGVCGEFFPAKQYIRSETVDSQMGEVECSKGNLFYGGWNQKMEVLSVEQLDDAAPEADKIIEEVRLKVAPDRRQVVYDITPMIENGKLTLTGKTSEQSVKDALREAFERHGVEMVDKIECYPTDQWAIVKLAVCCMRVNPELSAEMATQSIMGQPIRLFEKVNEDGWWRAQTPDGYIAYISSASFAKKTPEEMESWKSSDRVIVTSRFQTRIYAKQSGNGLRDVVSDAVLGNILEGKYDPKAKMTAVTLPDGRKGYIATSDIEPFDKWASQKFDVQKIIDTAYSMEGGYYLWGGTSTKAVDCSGMVKVSYFSNGIILMRDASQQIKTGKDIGTDWTTFKPGDLLFFGYPETGKVTHVALNYGDGTGDYIHSSGRVKRNSLNPKSPIFGAHSFISAVRIEGNIPSPGIQRVENHPWFFNK